MTNKLWDPFIRIYHFSQIILFALLWYSGDQGDLEAHFLYGYLILSLLITRVIWGLFGSQTARFIHFPLAPSKIKSFLLKEKSNSQFVSHNPLASMMIIALFISLFIQIFTGFFSTDEIMYDGPFYDYVSEEVALSLTSIHQTNINVLFGLIALHIVAALKHTFTGDNVIKAIITGHSKQKRPFIYYWSTTTPAILTWLCLFVIFATIF